MNAKKKFVNFNKHYKYIYFNFGRKLVFYIQIKNTKSYKIKIEPEVFNRQVKPIIKGWKKNDQRDQKEKIIHKLLKSNTIRPIKAKKSGSMTVIVSVI